jgi:hypothetical protein
MTDDPQSALAALGRLARLGEEKIDTAEVDGRLGLPAGFTEVASAVFTAYQHKNPAAFLEAAAVVHQAWMNGHQVIIGVPAQDSPAQAGPASH